MRQWFAIFLSSLIFSIHAYSLTSITHKTYENEVLQSKLPVVIDAYAPYCGHCRDMEPIFQNLSRKYSGKVKFVKLNVEKEAVFSDALDIQALPTFLFVKEGLIVDRATGAISEEELSQKIEQNLLQKTAN